MSLALLASARSVDEEPALLRIAATVICGSGIILMVTLLPRDFAIERRGADLFLVRPGRKSLRILSHESRASRINDWGVCTLRVESLFRRATVTFHQIEIAEGFARRLKKLGKAIPTTDRKGSDAHDLKAK